MTISSSQNPQVNAHNPVYPQSKTQISKHQNLSNWCYLIRDHISQGSPKEALLLYTQVRRKGLHCLAVVGPLVFKACASLSFINFGKAVHAESIKGGVDCEVMIGTSLVNMYAKCGNVVDSRRVFDYMHERNVVTWNAMIGGYLRNKDTRSASILFEKMSVRNGVTWIEMIDGFAKGGDTLTARQLFNGVPPELRNVVTWTVMVDGYTGNGEMEAAREFFEEMPQRNFFAWSSMISGYCKKGDVKEAKDIFDRIPVRNLVNWNSLISGYAQNGFCEEALEAFREMPAEGFEPDEVSIVSVLSACAQLGLLDAGKEIHCIIHRKGINVNVFVLNGLVDMYAKCGDLAVARLVFERIADKSTTCWNAMISGYANHGQCKEALEFFGRMENSNKMPDDITFLSVLSACAHGGYVGEGIEIFSKMEKYGLQASIKHYGCLVDLLGRVGRLKEAYDLIKRMPMKPNDTVWTAMLGACSVHLDMEMTEEIMKESTRNLNTVNANDSLYVLVSRIYAASDSWEKAERMRTFMVNQGLQKIPGCSSVMSR
jgi:pentatricopeptide repeat protein